MQYTSVVIAKEIPIDSLKVTARAHHSQEKRAFKDMIFQVYLEGGAVAEAAVDLAREASARCFVENTLNKSIPVTTEVHLNGKKILSSTRGPEGGDEG
ncbi:MAG TPA: OsmC family protein [Candidatus Binatia bacterium]